MRLPFVLHWKQSADVTDLVFVAWMLFITVCAFFFIAFLFAFIRGRYEYRKHIEDHIIYQRLRFIACVAVVCDSFECVEYLLELSTLEKVIIISISSLVDILVPLIIGSICYRIFSCYYRIIGKHDIPIGYKCLLVCWLGIGVVSVIEETIALGAEHGHGPFYTFDVYFTMVWFAVTSMFEFVLLTFLLGLIKLLIRSFSIVSASMMPSNRRYTKRIIKRMIRLMVGFLSYECGLIVSYVYLFANGGKGVYSSSLWVFLHYCGGHILLYSTIWYYIKVRTEFKDPRKGRHSSYYRHKHSQKAISDHELFQDGDDGNRGGSDDILQKINRTRARKIERQQKKNQAGKESESHTLTQTQNTGNSSALSSLPSYNHSSMISPHLYFDPAPQNKSASNIVSIGASAAKSVNSTSTKPLPFLSPFLLPTQKRIHMKQKQQQRQQQSQENTNTFTAHTITTNTNTNTHRSASAHNSTHLNSYTHDSRSITQHEHTNTNTDTHTHTIMIMRELEMDDSDEDRDIISTADYVNMDANHNLNMNNTSNSMSSTVNDTTANDNETENQSCPANNASINNTNTVNLSFGPSFIQTTIESIAEEEQ